MKNKQWDSTVCDVSARMLTNCKQHDWKQKLYIARSYMYKLLPMLCNLNLGKHMHDLTHQDNSIITVAFSFLDPITWQRLLKRRRIPDKMTTTNINYRFFQREHRWQRCVQSKQIQRDNNLYNRCRKRIIGHRDFGIFLKEDQLVGRNYAASFSHISSIFGFQAMKFPSRAHALY